MTRILPLCILLLGAAALRADYTEGSFSYTVTDGKATVTGFSDASERYLTVPSELGGYPVTAVGAEAFASDNTIYSLTLPGGLEEIAPRAFYDCRSLRTVTFKGSVGVIGESAFGECALTSLILPKGLTVIGASAFYGCSNLSTLTLPDTLTAIGDEAFYGCDGLRFVTLPESLRTVGARAFYSCGGLTSVTFPQRLESIGSDAFRLTGLQKVELYSGTVGPSAFAWCDFLAEIRIHAGVTEVDRWAFALRFPTVRTLELHSGLWENGSEAAFADMSPSTLIAFAVPEGMKTSSLTTVVVPENETALPDRAFEGCTVLTSLTLPAGLESVGTYAFSGCTALPEVSFPASLRSIGDWAFEGCTALTSLTLPAGLESVGTGAFYLCPAVSSVDFPSGLKHIGELAFASCRTLRAVTLPDGLETLGDSAFLNCSALETALLPDGLTRIGDGTFSDCAALTQVTLPAALESIGAQAFYSCQKLPSVTLPHSLESIGEAAFAACTALPSVSLPPGVRSLGARAFAGCTALTRVTLSPDLETVGEAAFLNCPIGTPLAFSETLRSIGSAAFAGCPLPGITFPARLQTSSGIIGDRAFAGCPLTSVKLPEGLKTLGASAFQDCTELGSVTLPAGLETLGASAFQGCAELGTVTLPGSVTAVGDGAFAGCSGLTRVFFDGAPPAVGSAPFPTPGVTGAYLWTYADAWASVIVGGTWAGLTMIENRPAFVIDGDHAVFNGPGNVVSPDYVIPDRLGGYPVTAIGNEAFATAKCQWTLTSVVIPDTVTVIGERAFQKCVLLESVTLPAALEEIGASAFYGCQSLTAVTLPETLTAIQDYAFYACKGLTSLTVPAGVAWIGNAAFSGGSSLTSVTFRGLPPQEAGTVYTYPPFQAQKDIPGTYPAMLADAWGELLDENSRWGGLKMSADASGPTLTAAGSEKLPGETALWLLNCLTERGVTSGAVALAEGTTAETLAAARTLGVVPALSRPAAGALQTLSGETLTVAAQAALEIAALDVSADGPVTLTLRVRALAGQLSAPYAPAGLFTLAGGPGPSPGAADPDGTPLWGDLLSGPLDWKRLDDTTAEAAVTLDTAGAARFFRARAQ